MKFASTILTIAGLSTAFASALPSTVTVPTNSGYKNYPLGVMTFEGTLGGHQVKLNGTVQEMNAKMTTLYPGFNADELLAARIAARDNDVEDRAVLMERSKAPPPLCCPIVGQDWSFCNAAAIQDGINYLDNFNGLCGVGPTSCVRISCSYSAAIYLCNDNGYTITPTCPYMGSYAGDIISSCAFYDSRGTGYVCGQEFDTDRYNIIVREDPC